MNPQLVPFQNLLTGTAAIIQKQEELRKLRGEHFNIFSVLNMEHRENATHSAFLGELLNPLGSHLFGNIFLSHFLKSIEYQGDLDVSTAQLKLEHHIGKRNDQKESGGRIDLYIYDNQGHSISIENKIYAVDQKKQVKRYVNYNKGLNTVYYLTLDGSEASKGSAGKLKVGEDYATISYSQHIIDWLICCQKEATDQPILRESIKQYMLLIKKLTNQLSDRFMEKEIHALIGAHYISAKSIEANVWKAELNAAKDLLTDILNKVKSQLGEGWQLWMDNDLRKKWTGLSLTHHSWQGMLIKLEGDVKIPWSHNYYGIIAHPDRWDREELKQKMQSIELLQTGFTETDGWPFFKKIFSLATDRDRERLFDETHRKALVEDVVAKMIELAKLCEHIIPEIKTKN